MAKQSKTLQLMSTKLGLSEEEKVISKAAEFERLLQMKSTTNNITDTAKAVICIDLAATMFRVDFDQKMAIKCSGLKGPSYTNSRKIVKNVLDLNTERLTVSALCLMLQCNVQNLAENILEEYRKQAKMELDMNLPQYVCMAVYQACRISKIKVSKSKLIDKSQLKSTQWTKLDAEWTKFTDEKFASVIKKKKGRTAKDAAIINREEKMEVDDEEAVIKKDEQTESEVEPYEDWKRRVLEKAYKDLENLRQNQNKLKNTPSKQKDTPIKQYTRVKHKDISNKQIDYSNNLKELANKHKDTTNKHKDTPNKHKDTPNKQKDTPNKQKDTPIKHKDTPNKQKDSPNNNKKDFLSANSSSDLDMSFSPRKSPRKTPQKFAPYQSPVKTKGVRLLFSV